jgi:hypothetical protein
VRRNLFWLSDEQWKRIGPHLPTDVRGVERVDDRRVISGIVHVLKSGCRWCDCPPDYGRMEIQLDSSASDRAGRPQQASAFLLEQFAEDVLSISPSNYDLAPALTDPFRKRFGYFMVHEAIEHAVALDVLVQAIERAKSAKPKAVTEALHGERFEGGWAKAMPGGAVQFDQTGLNTLAVPIMVQWRSKELVTVWPRDVAKASPTWRT